eukprot:5254312-Pyramimonas_sp.AAC.1
MLASCIGTPPTPPGSGDNASNAERSSWAGVVTYRDSLENCFMHIAELYTNMQELRRRKFVS